MPSVTVLRVFGEPRAEVWAVLSDIENARQWNKAWSRISITSSQRHGVGTTFRAYLDEGDTFDFEITDWTNLERLTIAPIHGDDERYPLMLKEHIFVLSDAPDNGTTVSLTAVVSAHGIRGRIWGQFFWPGHQQQGLNDALDALQSALNPEADEAEEPDTDPDPAAE